MSEPRPIITRPTKRRNGALVRADDGRRNRPFGPHGSRLVHGVLGDAIPFDSREGQFLVDYEAAILDHLGADISNCLIKWSSPLAVMCCRPTTLRATALGAILPALISRQNIGMVAGSARLPLSSGRWPRETLLLIRLLARLGLDTPKAAKRLRLNDYLTQTTAATDLESE